MLKKNHYMSAISCFIEYIKTKNLDKKIEAVYLSGSLGRGDYSPGRSDIDIYIVSKVEDNDLENKLFAKATEIVHLYLFELKKTCDNPFTIAITTFESIKNGSSWLGIGPEYQSFTGGAKLLLGNDIKALLPIPTPEQTKEISKQAIKMLIMGIQEMPEPTLEEDNKDYITKGIFEMIFSAMHYMLSSVGICIRGKKEMVDSFQDVSKDDSLKAICVNTLNLWSEFESRSFHDYEIRNLVLDGKKFVTMGYHEFFDL